MLKSLPMALTPKLYEILYSMGHGDRLVIADANFPGAANARRVYLAPGLSSCQTLELVLELFPIDNFVQDAVAYMAVAPGDDYLPTTWDDYGLMLAKNTGNQPEPVYLNREEFYQATRESYAVILTGETRRYGNLIIRKGIVE
jgi:L-fucose mutarotase